MRGRRDEDDALELLQEQRTRLASRLRPSWSYLALVILGWAVAFSMPIASRHLAGGGVATGLLSIGAFLAAEHALGAASGVRVGIDTWRFPSGRGWTVATVAVILAADAAETALLHLGHLAAATAVAVLATAAGTICWLGHLRGIRSDLAAGRTTT